MIKNLRKRHLQIWLLWALAFPLGIVVALNSRLKQPEDTRPRGGRETALPVTIKQWERDKYKVAVRCDSSKIDFQLEWINIATVTVPTMSIYLSKSEIFSIDQSILIGRIEEKGTYYFPINLSLREIEQFRNQLIMYDFIHNQIIDRLKFNQ